MVNPFKKIQQEWHEFNTLFEIRDKLAKEISKREEKIKALGLSSVQSSNLIFEMNQLRTYFNSFSIHILWKTFTGFLFFNLFLLIYILLVFLYFIFFPEKPTFSITLSMGTPVLIAFISLVGLIIKYIFTKKYRKAQEELLKKQKEYYDHLMKQKKE